MAYETGSYLKELEAEHAAGDHDETRHKYCNPCDRLRREDMAHEEGFASWEEYNAHLNEQARLNPLPKGPDARERMLLTAHEALDHEDEPHFECPRCYRSGRKFQ